MRYTFKVADEMVKVAPRSLANELVLAIGDKDYRVDFEHERNGRCSVNMLGKTYDAWVARDGDDIFVKLEGRYYKVTSFDPRSLAQGAGAGEGSVVAPMPGLAIEVLVSEGMEVAAGDKLLTIESMKLQSTILAPCAGVVEAINVSASVEFNKDDVLVVIATEAE